MQRREDLSKKEQLMQKASQILFKNRIWLLVTIGLVIGFVVVYFLATERINRIEEESTILVEEVETRYSNWVSEEDEVQKNQLGEEIVSETDNIIQKFPKTYGAKRALFIQGNFYFEMKNWEKGSASYLSLAEIFPESYLAEISLFNASICEEEIENYDKAIEIYQRLVDEYPGSYLTPQALFSLGRIFETTDRFTEAGNVYRQMEDSYPFSSWTYLAKNRLIYLIANEKIEK